MPLNLQHYANGRTVVALCWFLCFFVRCKFWSLFYCLFACFNPRTYVRCDYLTHLLPLRRRSFNPRTRMGCDWCGAQNVKQRQRFNPRTRMGCDAQKKKNSKKPRVSIRAPAWGAIALVVQLDRPSFNPRTRMGCDRISRNCSGISRRFNPRTRMGCDS